MVETNGVNSSEHHVDLCRTDDIVEASDEKFDVDNNDFDESYAGENKQGSRCLLLTLMKVMMVNMKMMLQVEFDENEFDKK